jgi:hypothetical protein
MTRSRMAWRVLWCVSTKILEPQTPGDQHGRTLVQYPMARPAMGGNRIRRRMPGRLLLLRCQTPRRGPPRPLLVRTHGRERMGRYRRLLHRMARRHASGATSWSAPSIRQSTRSSSASNPARTGGPGPLATQTSCTGTTKQSASSASPSVDNPYWRQSGTPAGMKSQCMPHSGQPPSPNSSLQPATAGSRPATLSLLVGWNAGAAPTSNQATSAAGHSVAAGTAWRSSPTYTSNPSAMPTMGRSSCNPPRTQRSYRIRNDTHSKWRTPPAQSAQMRTSRTDAHSAQRTSLSIRDVRFVRGICAGGGRKRERKEASICTGRSRHFHRQSLHSASSCRKIGVASRPGEPHTGGTIQAIPDPPIQSGSHSASPGAIAIRHSVEC